MNRIKQIAQVKEDANEIAERLRSIVSKFPDYHSAMLPQELERLLDFCRMLQSVAGKLEAAIHIVEPALEVDRPRKYFARVFADNEMIGQTGYFENQFDAEVAGLRMWQKLAGDSVAKMRVELLRSEVN